jgi:hypothetical protein
MKMEETVANVDGLIKDITAEEIIKPTDAAEQLELQTEVDLAVETEAGVEEEKKDSATHFDEPVVIVESVPVQSVAPSKKDEINVIIRPVCEEWQMGEDWNVSFPFLKTFVDLKLYIEEKRGISAHRMQLKLKGKLLTYTREKWTLRRMGVYDGYVIQVEPTLKGSWWWNSYDYYVSALLTQIKIAVDNAGGGISLSELEPLVTVPLPVKVSLKVFVRSYPEHLHIHCNTALRTYRIEKSTKLCQIPTFTSVPYNLGGLQYESFGPFDWDSYKDIDDKYKIETTEVEELVEEKIIPSSDEEEGEVELDENEDHLGEPMVPNEEPEIAANLADDQI